MTSQIVQAAVFAGALFFGVLACFRMGWRFGRHRLQRAGEDSTAGIGAIEGSVYALMGLLIAFTFTSAASRFEHRRELVTKEVNAIGTAWTRLDLLQSDARTEARELFRMYVDARVSLYEAASEPAAVVAGLARSNALQGSIWSHLIAAVKDDPSPRLATLVLPPVNEMFDIANERTLATRNHPPVAIYLLLALLVIVSAVLAGFGMAKANTLSTLHVIGFAFVVSLAVYLIIDLDYPRLGLLRVDAADRAFADLRASMK